MSAYQAERTACPRLRVVKCTVLRGLRELQFAGGVHSKDGVAFDDGQSRTANGGFGNTVPLSPFPRECRGEDRAGISAVHLSDPVGNQAGTCFGGTLLLGCVLSVSGSAQLCWPPTTGTECGLGPGLVVGMQ